MLDPLRGCATCGWQICAYHYMIVPYVGPHRNMVNVHAAVVEGHNADIICFREMTSEEALVGK